MLRRHLGQAGPEVSAIGIGAMSFSNFYGPCTEAEAHALLDAARDHGIDHLDTSNIYGMGLSERIIGRYLAARGPAARQHFRIATKAGIRQDPETGERSIDNSRGHLEAELDASLARLGVDRVDLYYVHRRDTRHSIEAVTETLSIKCERALVQTGRRALVVAGGVGANRRLRERLAELAERRRVQVCFPRLEFCTDNGAMIAFAGALRLAAGEREPAAIRARPRWDMAQLAPI